MSRHDRLHTKKTETQGMPSIHETVAPEQAYQYQEDSGLSTQRVEQLRKKRNRNIMLGVGTVAAGAVATVALILGGESSGSSNNPDEARSDTTAGAPAKSGEKPAENLTPLQAVGIEQTSYSNVNTPEAASKPEVLAQARQLIPADTPLDQAVVLMGEKQNIYMLTGDPEVFAAMYGADRTGDSEEMLEVKGLRGHSNDRFTYMKKAAPDGVVYNKVTFDKVDVTEHESFVPIAQTGPLSMTLEIHHVTNFEDVDRSEVFENDKLDNPFVDEGEITFRVKDGKLFTDDIV